MAEAGERTIRPDRTTLAAFVTFVTLAGGNVIAVRSVSCEDCELDPFWAAASRFLLASLILAGIALVVRGGMPRGRALLGAALYGVLGFGAAFAFAPGACNGCPRAWGPCSSRPCRSSRSRSRCSTGRSGSGGTA